MAICTRMHGNVAQQLQDSAAADLSPAAWQNAQKAYNFGMWYTSGTLSKKKPGNPYFQWFPGFCNYSNSIVAGGFPVQSYSTRFTCGTSLTIRLATVPRTSHGSLLPLRS